MNEFQIQKEMAKSLKTVTLRMWGRWAGDQTRPRFVCNQSLQHQFNSTVEACADREASTGFACPMCAELREEHTVDFETFAKDAKAVNAIRKKAADKAKSKAARSSGNHYGLDRYAV